MSVSLNKGNEDFGKRFIGELVKQLQHFANNINIVLMWFKLLTSHHNLGPVYMEWGTPVWWGWFLLFSRPERHKTKETYPTTPGSPTPCKQGLGDAMEVSNSQNQHWTILQ